MNASPDPTESVRIIPENWLEPLPLENFFGNPLPLEVDVGCGKGRFLLSRAASHQGTHFLGIDRMLRRIRKVDRKAVRRGLRNVRLLRLDAYYAVTYLIPADAVSTYYIFFPDPWPKKRHHQNRLFDAAFMDALHRTLQPAGRFHFATDHLPYFEGVKELVGRDPRFGEIPPFQPGEEERTDFELLFIGKAKIGRCSFEKTQPDA